MMPFPDRRKNWTEIRSDYYSSGRLAFKNGLFFAGAIQLAYVVETHFQAIAYEHYQGANLNKNPWKKHDIEGMFKELTNLGLLINVKVSEDFLKYISYNFNRYPGQVVPSKKEMSELYGGSAIGVTMIHYYDHLILQLDRVIYEMSNDSNSSMILNSLKSYNLLNNLCILAENKAVQKELPYYLDLLKNNSPQSVLKIEEYLQNFNNLETLDLIVKPHKSSKIPESIKNLFGELKPENFKLPTEKGKWTF